MKTSILIKQHSCIQLGHLYEHLYLHTANSLLLENGCFKFLDYAIHGTTFDKTGVIQIEYELYSEKAMKFADQLSSIKLKFTDIDKLIDNSILQIIAEEECKILITSKTELLGQLEILDSQPWSLISEISFLHLAATSLNPIKLGDSSKTSAIDVVVSSEEPLSELSPLFNFISRIILLTYGNEIARHRGYYPNEIIGDMKPTLHLRSTMLAPDNNTEKIDLKKDMKLFKDVFTKIDQEDIYKRILLKLQSISYESSLYASPDQNVISDETGIFVGEQGWKKISTMENLNLVFDSIRLHLHYEQDTITETPRDK